MFEQRGWCRFAHDPRLAAWVAHAHKVAAEIAADSGHIAEWLRCGGTWFAGVNILPNDVAGRLPSGPALAGEAVDFVEKRFGRPHWDQAQISVIYPGYPKPMEGETPAAFRFRRDRDAAHVDGLLPLGATRRRHLQEPHGFVLGLPLSSADRDASPMVVWEGSHEIMRAVFAERLQGVAPADWGGVDLTDIYQAARRRCFDSCPRVTIHAQPGEAYLIHRLALHGVAPWGADAVAPPEGRMIAYFRPELPAIADWLA